MFPKRLLALTLFAALAVMPTCALRAQWVQTNGFGTTIIGLGFCGSDLIAYGGGAGAGVFRSTNNGLTWEALSAANTGLSSPYINALAVIGQEVFVGTSGGVLLTTDLGSNWTSANSGLDDLNVNDLCVNGTNLFAATDSGLFLTTNQGTSWNFAGLRNSYCNAIGVAGESLFVGSDRVFLSTNNGLTWDTTALLGMTSVDFDGINIFASTMGLGVSFSSTDGDTWKEINTGLTDTFVYDVTSIGSILLAGTQNGIFRSTDSGNNWSAADSGLANRNVFGFAANKGTLCAAAGGIFRSTDSGTSWMGANKGLSNAWITSIINSGSNLIVATFNRGIFLSSDNGINWIEADSGIPIGDLFLNSLFASDSVLFAGSDQGLYFSHDNGMSWQECTNGIPSLNVSAYAFKAGNIFVGAKPGMFMSTDLGSSWLSIDSGLKNINISSIMVSGSNLYAGTSGSGVYFSTDNGTSWNGASNGLTDSTISSLALIGTNLFAGTTNTGVFLSTNNGASWVSANNGISNVEVTSLAVSGIKLFAAIWGSGIYISTNNGSNWTPVNTGLTDNQVTTISVSNTNLFAGTLYSGLYSRPISEMMGQSAVSETLASDQELQSYPNPFSQSTRITFTSQVAGYAEVSIVNMLGVEVARLFSGELGAGEHSWMWGTPTGLPDGTYECLVRMNGQVETLPILLLH
jgi:photosystem II stability/assembly factor-like uncharacterized protein